METVFTILLLTGGWLLGCYFGAEQRSREIRATRLHRSCEWKWWAGIIIVAAALTGKVIAANPADKLLRHADEVRQQWDLNIPDAGETP